jgi:hypothetical protein
MAGREDGMSSYCNRCRRFIPTHKTLWWKQPVKRFGVRFLTSGYGVCESSHAICDDCYEELKRFWDGKAIEAVTYEDECPSCGALMQRGAFCSECGKELRGGAE